MSEPAGKLVTAADLLTISDLARLLGLPTRQAADYVARRPTFPRPVRTIDPGRIRIWLRVEVEAWIGEHRPRRRHADARPV